MQHPSVVIPYYKITNNNFHCLDYSHIGSKHIHSHSHMHTHKRTHKRTHRHTIKQTHRRSRSRSQKVHWYFVFSHILSHSRLITTLRGNNYPITKLSRFSLLSFAILLVFTIWTLSLSLSLSLSHPLTYPLTHSLSAYSDSGYSLPLLLHLLSLLLELSTVVTVESIALWGEKVSWRTKKVKIQIQLVVRNRRWKRPGSRFRGTADSAT